MLTAYDTYHSAKEAIFTAETFEQIHQASRDTVENYLENRCIWDELNYYKQHGTILGNHTIFAYMQRMDAIRHMKVGDLVTMKIRVENNLVKNRAMVRRQPGHIRTAQRLERIRSMEQELVEVNRLLYL